MTELVEVSGRLWSQVFGSGTTWLVGLQFEHHKGDGSIFLHPE